MMDILEPIRDATMDLVEPIHLARARYNFTGKNNDELTFVKNDIITVTQQLDGGWWEGTLSGNTGWFPSNYVVPVNERDKLMRSKSVPNANVLSNGVTSNGSVVNDFVGSISTMNQFRAEVIQDFISSEEVYVTNVKRTFEELLLPIKNSSCLSNEDFITLSCNIEQILIIQSEMLLRIKDVLRLEACQQQIGGILIHVAPEIKELLLTYCENHPKAVEVLNEKRDVLEQTLTTMGKDMQMLITGLSEPFRHLEKYPTMLQELERNMQDAHIDRGNIQRSCAVYKEIKVLCEAIRKQKELQLELLYTGQVEGWASFEERGRILYVGIGGVVQGGETRDRCIALFSKLLFILEITLEQNCYKLLAKIPTNDLRIRILGRCEIIFGDWSLLLPSFSEVDRWLSALTKCDGIIMDEIMTEARSSSQLKTNSLNQVIATLVEGHDLQKEKPYHGKRPSYGSSHMKFNHELEMILPEGVDEPDRVGVQQSVNGSERKKLYSGHCLRSVPPHRSHQAILETGKKSVKMRREVCLSDQDDALLLRIVEGYCSGAARAVISSIESQPPQLIVAGDEKMLVEEIIGDEVVIQEKSLVDTVYALRDQVAGLRQDLSSIAKNLEKEQKARRRLEEIVRRGSTLFSSSQVQSSKFCVEMSSSQ